MDAKDIIFLLREAAIGLSEYSDPRPDPEGQELEVLTKFAELVAQKEREACAKVCEKLADDAHTIDQYDTISSAWRIINARSNAGGNSAGTALSRQSGGAQRSES